MKKILPLLFFLNSYAAFSQLKPLQSITWVSDNLGRLRFTNKDHIFWELDQSFKSYGRFMDCDFAFYQSKDTLVLVDPYRLTSLSGKPKQPVLYKFMMARTENEVLSLSPVNASAKEAIPQPVYVLRNIAYVDDHTVNFASIHVDNGGSSLRMPGGIEYSERTVNIDSQGNYYSKILSDGFRSPAIYFKGKLNARQLDSLNYFVRHSEIKKLQNWKEIVRADHAGRLNLVIAYNNEVLKLNAGFLPGITDDLLNYIRSLATKLTLTPDAQKHDFKQEGDLNYYR